MFGVEFRPLDFGSVYGLDNIRELLKAYLEANEYEIAYLFEGPPSSGKTTLGRIFARAILCEDRKEDMSPCNKCLSCREFIAERNPAYIEIDAANKGSKEDIQKLLEKVNYENFSKKMIIFLDECHEISKAGNDSLLQQFEKNNPDVIFIMGTTEVDKVAEPLRTRCAAFHFPAPTEDLIQLKLEKICKLRDLEYTQDALHALVRSSGRHYRVAEINLGMASKLGDITSDNVSKIVMYHDKEIAYLLSTLPYDLSKAMKAADYLLGCMNVKDIYHGILRLLVDTVKAMQGFTFASEEYAEILSILVKQYGDSCFEIIDYLLSKQRLVDLTTFQSDLLVIHYKFLQDQFQPKDRVKKTHSSIGEASTGDKKTGVQSEMASSLQYINSRPPWERESLVRKFKADKLKEQKEEALQENVSSEWDIEEVAKKDTNTAAVLKGNLTEKNFAEALKESLDEGSI